MTSSMSRGSHVVSLQSRLWRHVAPLHFTAQSHRWDLRRAGSQRVRNLHRVKVNIKPKPAAAYELPPVVPPVPKAGLAIRPTSAPSWHRIDTSFVQTDDEGLELPPPADPTAGGVAAAESVSQSVRRVILEFLQACVDYCAEDVKWHKSIKRIELINVGPRYEDHDRDVKMRQAWFALRAKLISEIAPCLDQVVAACGAAARKGDGDIMVSAAADALLCVDLLAWMQAARQHGLRFTQPQPWDARPVADYDPLPMIALVNVVVKGLAQVTDGIKSLIEGNVPPNSAACEALISSVGVARGVALSDRIVTLLVFATAVTDVGPVRPDVVGRGADVPIELLKIVVEVAARNRRLLPRSAWTLGLNAAAHGRLCFAPSPNDASPADTEALRNGKRRQETMQLVQLLFDVVLTDSQLSNVDGQDVCDIMEFLLFLASTNSGVFQSSPNTSATNSQQGYSDLVKRLRIDYSEVLRRCERRFAAITYNAESKPLMDGISIAPHMAVTSDNPQNPLKDFMDSRSEQSVVLLYPDLYLTQMEGLRKAAPKAETIARYARLKYSLERLLGTAKASSPNTDVGSAVSTVLPSTSGAVATILNFDLFSRLSETLTLSKGDMMSAPVVAEVVAALDCALGESTRDDVGRHTGAETQPRAPTGERPRDVGVAQLAQVESASKQWGGVDYASRDPHSPLDGGALRPTAIGSHAVVKNLMRAIDAVIGRRLTEVSARDVATLIGALRVFWRLQYVPASLSRIHGLLLRCHATLTLEQWYELTTVFASSPALASDSLALVMEPRLLHWTSDRGMLIDRATGHPNVTVVTRLLRIVLATARSSALIRAVDNLIDVVHTSSYAGQHNRRAGRQPSSAAPPSDAQLFSLLLQAICHAAGSSMMMSAKSIKAVLSIIDRYGRAATRDRSASHDAALWLPLIEVLSSIRTSAESGANHAGAAKATARVPHHGWAIALSGLRSAAAVASLHRQSTESLLRTWTRSRVWGNLMKRRDCPQRVAVAMRLLLKRTAAELIERFGTAQGRARSAPPSTGESGTATVVVSPATNRVATVEDALVAIETYVACAGEESVNRCSRRRSGTDDRLPPVIIAALKVIVAYAFADIRHRGIDVTRANQSTQIQNDVSDRWSRAMQNHTGLTVAAEKLCLIESKRMWTLHSDPEKLFEHVG